MSDPGNALGAVCRHARMLARLQSVLAGCADPDTTAHFQVANVRQDRLILVTPTAAWATRLRMHAPQWIRFLQESGHGHLRHIDIRVAPLAHEAPRLKIHRRLSPAAQQAIEQLKRLIRR